MTVFGLSFEMFSERLSSHNFLYSAGVVLIKLVVKIQNFALEVMKSAYFDALKIFKAL